MRKVVKQRDGLERLQHWPHKPIHAGSNPAPAIMADDLDSAIETNANGPRQASSDGLNVQQHSLSDQIAADKHLASKRAGRNPAKALTRVKIIPPGTV